MGANPVRGEARLSFALPAHQHVRLTVYDVAGREVEGLVDQDLPSGHHVVAWNPAATHARAAGVFFAQLSVPGTSLTQRPVVLE